MHYLFFLSFLLKEKDEFYWCKVRRRQLILIKINFEFIEHYLDADKINLKKKKNENHLFYLIFKRYFHNQLCNFYGEMS